MQDTWKLYSNRCDRLVTMLLISALGCNHPCFDTVHCSRSGRQGAHALLSGDQAVVLNLTLLRVSLRSLTAPVLLSILSTLICSQSEPPLWHTTHECLSTFALHLC